MPRAIGLLMLGMLTVCGCGQPSQEAPDTGEEPVSPTRAETPPPDSPTAPAGSASIQGTVMFAGTPPAPQPLKMDADPQCLLQHEEPVHSQEVVVNSNGTLRYVFVYVKDGSEGQASPPSKPVVFDQQGCQYRPHVLGIQVNQPLEIVNSDPTLHNVNCKPTKSQPFNLAQPTKGMKATKKFTAPEIMVKCACNVHPWMAAYIGVVAHPYFGVTGEDGGFMIANLPAGDYTLEAWHEKYGTKTQTVSVGDGETAQVEFAFK